MLPKNEIAGFLRTEQRSDGAIFFPDVIFHYHWDVGSIRRRGEYKFAYFSDEHSGSYILTKEQLLLAIASGGFLVPFYDEKYPPLETAATDPFTQCGFRKMMCISHFQSSSSHLSNKYAGNGIAVAGEEFYRQLDALSGFDQNGNHAKALFPVETKLYHCHWSKWFYEPCQKHLIALVPKAAKNVLSVGCGWGVTEKKLIEEG